MPQLSEPLPSSQTIGHLDCPQKNMWPSFLHLVSNLGHSLINFLSLLDFIQKGGLDLQVSKKTIWNHFKSKPVELIIMCDISGLDHMAIASNLLA